MKKNYLSLDGKVVVLTGAAGLLGQNYAEAIAAHGANLVLLDINKNTLEKLSKEISQKYSVKVMPYALDITNEDKVKECAEEVQSVFKKIDGLINNAANNPKVENNDIEFSRLENFLLDSWNKDIAVGLTGSFLCSKYFGSIISNTSKNGSIINISSDLGLIAPDQNLYKIEGLNDENQPVKPVTYSVVKTGIIGLTRYLSTYWAKKNVRCNALCPGGVENGQNEDFLDLVSKKIPLNRLAKKDEYNSVIVWMLRDSASYLNGAVIPVDGGRTTW